MGKDKDKEERETPGGQETMVDSADQEKNMEEENLSSETEEAKENENLEHDKAGKKDPKDVQIEEMQDRLMRQMAEFDNFRKRTEKEKSAMYEVGAREMIEKILPVLDNFERALAAVPEEEKGSSFAEGVEMIYKQIGRASCRERVSASV